MHDWAVDWTEVFACLLTRWVVTPSSDEFSWIHSEKIIHVTCMFLNDGWIQTLFQWITRNKVWIEPNWLNFLFRSSCYKNYYVISCNFVRWSFRALKIKMKLACPFWTRVQACWMTFILGEWKYSFIIIKVDYYPGSVMINHLKWNSSK